MVVSVSMKRQTCQSEMRGGMCDGESGDGYICMRLAERSFVAAVAVLTWETEHIRHLRNDLVACFTAAIDDHTCTKHVT